MTEPLSPDILYDIAVIGCGPAGLSAAINAKVRNKSVAVLGVEFCTPKLHKAHKVDNYLGFRNITGAALREQFFNHFRSMGLVERPGRVDSVIPAGDRFNLVVKTEMFQARTVVLATGISHAQEKKACLAKGSAIAPPVMPHSSGKKKWLLLPIILRQLKKLTS